MNEQKTEHQPEISIIVPVYKVEKYLNECIDSILTQTFTDFELILVDDGSPDNCPALCDAAAKRDSRVRVIHQQNKGLSGARNAGIDIARGNWLGFVDSDDVIDRTFYEKLHTAAVHAGAEMAVCDILGVDENGKKCPFQYELLKNEVLTNEEVIRRMRLTPLVNAATKLYKREIFAALRYPEGKNYEDAFIAPAIYESIKHVACVGEQLYHYRINPEGIMKRRVDIKNLDEVEANYGLFECALKHGKTDVLLLEYTLMQKILRRTEKNLSPEDRQSARMQEILGMMEKARTQLEQNHAVTISTRMETLFYRISPQLYYNFKYKR